MVARSVVEKTAKAYDHQLRDIKKYRCFSESSSWAPLIEMLSIETFWDDARHHDAFNLGYNWRHFHNFLEEDQMKWAKCSYFEVSIRCVGDNFIKSQRSQWSCSNSTPNTVEVFAKLQAAPNLNDLFFDHPNLGWGFGWIVWQKKGWSLECLAGFWLWNDTSDDSTFEQNNNSGDEKNRPCWRIAHNGLLPWWCVCLFVLLELWGLYKSCTTN